VSDALVDASLSYPNLAGVPLWLLPTPLPPADEQAVVELWRRARAQQSLAEYSAYCLDVEPALHHRLICEAIEGMVLRDECDVLVINTPPGAAKSTYTSHAATAWFMGRFPRKNIILATHTSDLSEKWSRKVRNTIGERRHSLVFPQSELSKDSTAVGRWATSGGGEFLAAGVGGSILGFRADFAVIDDPHSGFEEAQSITQLQKAHNWYEGDLLTRLKPGGKQVIICQRLNANDMAGYVIQRNAENPSVRCRTLVFRMEAEAGDDDGTQRAPGDILWPEWFTREMVEDARRDDFKWRTLYQQRPPSESGDWVSKDEIKIIDIAPTVVTYYLLTDLALSVNSGDYSVHLIVAVDTQQNVHVVDAWRERCAIDRTVEKHLELVQTYGPAESLIDDDNAAKVYVQLLASRARERGIAVPWKTMPMRGQDKETRAAPLRGLFKRGKVFLLRAPWNEWLLRELLVFPNAMGEGVDDGVDALGLIGRRLASLARPTAPEAEKPRPKYAHEATLNELWEDKEQKIGGFRCRV